MFLAGLLFVVLGLIAALGLPVKQKPEEEEENRIEKCNHDNETGKYCTDCGKKLDSVERKEYLFPEEIFCPSYGTNLELEDEERTKREFNCSNFNDKYQKKLRSIKKNIIKY